MTTLRSLACLAFGLLCGIAGFVVAVWGLGDAG